MKKLLLILLLISGCRDITTYQSQISLKNDMKNSIFVNMYPKKEYASFDTYNLYGKGVYRDNKFEIQSGQEYNIISKPNAEVSPIDIINERFDSLEINIGSKILKFKPKKQQNYSINLFDDVKNWEYKKNKSEFQTQFKRNPVVFDDYYFHIDSSKIK